MDGPVGMTMDASGNIYFVDAANFRIRKMTPAGVVTTIAGDGYSFLFYGRERNNAVGSEASFNWPSGIVLDTANNCLYVTDKENDVIRKVSLTGTFAVTTFAGSGTSSSVDGTGTAATFKKPNGIAIDPTNKYLYVTDRTGNKIRRITISNVQVLTIAGNGTASTVDNATGTLATFNDPTGIAVDANFIYVSDFGGNKIRKIALVAPFAVTTLAGSGAASSTDGTGVAAAFDTPFGITLDGAGNLYVAEWGNKIRKITINGNVSTIAGNGVASSLDGNGIAATFNDPSGIVINPTTGIGYVSEYTGDRIRKIELGGYAVSPVLPAGLSFDILTGSITGTPTTLNNGPLDYKITGYNYYGSSTATVSITTGTVPSLNTTEASVITATTAKTGGNVYNYGGSNLLERGICWSTSPNPDISDTKVVDGTTASVSFVSNITGLTATTTYYIRAYATNVFGTSYGTQVSFTTLITPPIINYTATNNFTVNTPITTLAVSNTGGTVSGLASTNVSTFAGSTQGYANASGTAAKFNYPNHVASDASGTIYVSDSNNFAIRKITPAGLVSTLAGGNGGGVTDGTGINAQFTYPNGIATDRLGNVFVADGGTGIRKIDASGIVTTLLSSIYSLIDFGNTKGIVVDNSGIIYFSDNSSRIYKIDTSNNLTVFAGGNYISGTDDGIGTSARFNNPSGLAVDATGNIYVADTSNHRIRKITPSGAVTTLAGSTSGFNDGTGVSAKFSGPIGITVDSSGTLYVADTGNKRIRKITSMGVVTTIAGIAGGGSIDGNATLASFLSPNGITSDSEGNLYIVDFFDSKIRKITTSYGFSILPALPAGLVLNADGSISGTPTMASAAITYTVTATNAGGSSSFAVSIEILTNPTLSTKPVTSVTATTATTGGIINSQLATVTASGICYSTSPFPTLANSFTTDVPTEGAGFSTALNSFTTNLSGLVPGTKYYFRAYATNSVGTGYGMEYTFTTSILAPLYSKALEILLKVNTAIAPILATNEGGAVPNLIKGVSTIAGSIAGYTDGTTDAAFTNPTDVVKDSKGNLFVTDSSNNAIRKISPSGTVSTFAGGTAGSADGLGSAAQFFIPCYIAIDADDNLYVSDSGNNRIRKITPSGLVSTLAGDGSTTIFNQPKGLTLDALGNVYVADYGNNNIKKITPAGIVSIYFSSKIFGPLDVAFNSEGALYVCQEGQNSVLMCSFSTGIPAPLVWQYGISPLAISFDKYDTLYLSNNLNLYNKRISDSGLTPLTNSISAGTTDGAIGRAKFNNLSGMTIDNDGVIYAADQLNNRIRRINLYGYFTAGLPAGFVLNENGSITGTPLTAISRTLSYIAAYNSGGTNSAAIYITVNDKPSVQTIDAIHILSNYADSGVKIINDNYSDITTMGVCWSTSTNPTIADNINATNDITQVYFPISGLSPLTTYYYRAYATNSVGTAYGNELSFTTLALADVPPVITYNASNTFTANSAIASLTVTNTGGAVQSYSVSPALPTGLALNADGSITGTPTVATAATDYVVTGTNSSGSSSYTISISVESCTNPIITITTPESVCEGYGIELFSTTSAPIKNSFTGGYAVSNWVYNNINTDGSIDTSTTPTSISITSGDNGTNTIGYTDYTITIPENATLSFGYDYTTNDDAAHEAPYFIINGVSRLFYGFHLDDYDDDQSGSISVSVLAGDVFTFRMKTNNNYGTAAVVISNFQIAPSLLWTASNGGTIYGSNNNPMVEISSTGTYTVTATSGTC
jgi:sugar lactone lactonase YvrE